MSQIERDTSPITVDQVLVDDKPFDLLAKPPACPHPAFLQQVQVADLRDPNTDEHVTYRAQLKIRCAECGCQFRFTVAGDGRPHAEISADRLTAGLLIEPASNVELDGFAPVEPS